MPTETNPTTPAAMTDEQAEREAKRILTNFAAGYATSYRDDSPLPARGDAPPVPQPGRPAMSEKATDASVLMLAAGGSSLMVGGSASLVMWASHYANPTVIGLICAAPPALVLALARLMKRAKATVEAMPAEQHNHYNAPVTQTTVNTRTAGVWAKTNNHTKD